MARIARVVIPGVPHHVTQRGNARQRIFYEEAHYRLYLRLLRRRSGEHGLRIWAWCLMPNHVHLIAVPERADSLARALGRIHADFARLINIQRGSCGHLWQARFYSCPLDWGHLWSAMAYVERNPVRAKLCEEAAAYRWSSAAVHCGLVPAPPWIELGPWQAEYGCQRWREVLARGLDEEALAERIRSATRSGRPLGSDEFVERMENLAGRPLRAQRRGRRADPDRALAAAAGSEIPLEIGN